MNENRNLARTIIFVFSIVLVLFGLFGESIIAKLNPNYNKYNRAAVVEAYQKINKENINSTIHALIINIRSNELYNKAKKAANNFIFLGLIIFIISEISWTENNLKKLFAIKRTVP